MLTAAVEYPAAIAASACRTSAAVRSRSLRACLVGGQDTFADCLYLVDPVVSRVSGLEHGGDQSE
jgi:hypothetical protein